ncbi:hypothetical protein DICVIV_13713 [Dictyocaulus viviparus]|uniref:Uncharacterized protein n=1 Tax=Dictyocaulus viviparus TaxID=29172 RepID=A0A0D8X9A8_DICVI|nr:hypothetical protein DICVIV_13713 [Dictyocaulus viviparus]
MTYYKTGHFTQLIWKESQRIGIGVAIVHDDGRGNGLCQSTKPLYLIYIVVKYDPAVNALKV